MRQLPLMPSYCFIHKLSTVILSKSKQRFRFLHVGGFKTRLALPTVHQDESNDQDAELFFQFLYERKLEQARVLFDKMPHRGSRSSVIYWTSKLSTYARRGFVEEARMLFEFMPVRNTVTWNAMLSAYSQSGRIRDACQLFDEMPERNVVSWTSMLCGFRRAGMIEDAKSLFNVMPERNVVSYNSMIAGLAQNGDLEGARQLFNRMPLRNLISWNAMIAGYADNLMMGEARHLFDAMVDANVVTWTCLISGYCRVGDIEEAYHLFEKMPVRNIVSWTAMIGGFAWNGFYQESLQLFLQMKETECAKPNVETYISLFYACSGLGFSCLGKQLHAQLILNEFSLADPDGRLSKSLIHMYSKFGIMDIANDLFSRNSNKLVVASCNSMINGYVKIGQLEKAREMFEKTPVRDSISWTSMISGYLYAGNVIEACSLFDRMPSRDSVSWTAMISGHVQNELFEEAIHLFSDMRAMGIRPLDSTYSTLLGAAGAMAYLEQGKQFHCLLLKTQFQPDMILENSLISMYAKCGEINDARRIFSKMTLRDTVSWNSMTVGLSHHGLANETLKLLGAMLDIGLKPNSVTFLGVLSACSHAGMINEGWELFNSMTRDHGIQPSIEHYTCMIDLLGRAGKVAEAEELVKKLPFEPGIAVWGALLGVCGLGEVNVDVGIHAAKQVLEIEPLNAPAHVLLCNIYAACDQHAEEEMLRKAMGLKGVRKVPGCSWIMLRKRVHVFLCGDRSHVQTDQIYSLLVGDS